MINDKPLICFDFETTSAKAVGSTENPSTCGITQIAAVVIHGRRLEIIGEFNRDNIKWHEDDDISDEAFKVTRKDKAFIEKNGYCPKQAWAEFTSFVHEFNPKRSVWGAPIPCGYNINGFDMPLLEKYCQKYGPIDNKSGRGCLVSNYMQFDVLNHLFWWFESNAALPNMKLDTLRDYFGMDKEGAHDALVDVTQTAQIAIKLLRLYRDLHKKIKFAGAFA